MSRLLAVALAALLVFAAVPAFADEAADTLADSTATEDVLACENPDGLEVVTLDGVDSDIAAPGLTLVDSEAKSFLVDLGADSTDVTADLTVDMSWDALLNDYDLEVAAGDETARSENAQPFDASEESVTLSVAHCQVIEVVAYNFFALQPTTSLALAFGAPAEAGEAADAETVLPALPSVEALTALPLQ
jgi:hypothetical protein